MFLAKNIRFLRQRASMTQEALSVNLGVQRTMISAYEDGRSEPKLSSLQILSRIFDVSLDELIGRDIEQAGRKFTQADPVKVLAITVDRDDNEWISLIGQKVSAGYLNGYADPEYVENLPQFHLPLLSKNQTYRAFEISGDSMLPLEPGTVIVGGYLEKLMDIKNGKTYVLVTLSEGIVYKRVFNYLEEKGKLFLVSDNELYKPYELSATDILEVWEAKAYISTAFPQQGEKNKPLTLDDIGKMIQDLRADIVKAK